MSAPLVSVIIPCYQQGRYLSDAITSVIGQTYPRVETIVVNDGSTDDTAEVAARFGDRIRYVTQENAGLSAARNTGLRECTGDYAVFLDADDVLLPHMVSGMAAALEDHADCGAAHCGYMLTLDDCRDTDWICMHEGEGDLFDSMCTHNCFIVHAAMTRLSVLRQAGPFDTTLRANEDWDLWLRVAALGTRWVRVPEVLVKYRQRPRTMGKTVDWVLHGSRTVLERAKELAIARNCGNAAQYEERFQRAWRDSVLRIGAILVYDDRLEECRALFQAEIGDALGNLSPGDCGRRFWNSFTGVAGIPPSRWQEIWLHHSPQLCGYANLMQDLTGCDGYAEQVLANMEPFRSLRLDSERLVAIEQSTSWRIGRMITRWKFW